MSKEIPTQIKAATPYTWPYDASFCKETTALIIIDMQRDFCDPLGYFATLGYNITPIRALIPRLQYLLHAWRKAGWRVYHTREGHRPDLSTLPARELHRSRVGGAEIGSPGPLGRFLVRGEEGHDIIPELYPVDGEVVVDKPMRSAFSYTDFDLVLRNAGVRNLVVVGVTTDVCVFSTVKDAIERGYDVVLLEDGTAAADKEIHDAVVRSVQMEGGIAGCVAMVEDVIGVLRTGMP